MTLVPDSETPAVMNRIDHGQAATSFASLAHGRLFIHGSAGYGPLRPAGLHDL